MKKLLFALLGMALISCSTQHTIAYKMAIIQEGRIITTDTTIRQAATEKKHIIWLRRATRRNFPENTPIRIYVKN